MRVTRKSCTVSSSLLSLKESRSEGCLSTESKIIPESACFWAEQLCQPLCLTECVLPSLTAVSSLICCGSTRQPNWKNCFFGNIIGLTELLNPWQARSRRRVYIVSWKTAQVTVHGRDQIHIWKAFSGAYRQVISSPMSIPMYCRASWFLRVQVCL